MQRKFYIFLIFPGHGKPRKIRLPLYAVYLLVVVSIIGFVTLGALANSYARMLLKVSKYNNLRNESEALKSQYRTLQSAVKSANLKLNSLESLAGEVSLAYGFGDPRHSPFPALAPLVAAGIDSTPDAAYRASIYAFDFMKNAGLNPATRTSPLDLLSNPPMDSSAIPSIWPVKGRISAGFGERMDPLNGEGAFHPGIDIAAPYGASVRSAGDGIVVYAGREEGYGREILIDHGFGIRTKYAHLSKIDVVVGETVKRGQVIGAVGMSGRTTGPHLHYEVLVHETPVNPARYLHG